MATRRAWWALAGLALLAAACATDPGVSSGEAFPAAPPSTDSPPTVPGSAAPPATTTPTTPPPTVVEPTVPPTPPVTSGLPPIVEPELYTEVDLAAVVDVGESKPPREHDPLLAVALADIDQWLAEQMPVAWGIDWTPLAGGIYAGYPERQSVIPGCGELETRYEDLMLYAAFYCEFGDFMAYDDGEDGIIVGLADELGPAVLGIVLAHEYGHTVQERIGALDEELPTVFTEQQADCISGAWVGRVYRGESPNLRLGDRDVRAGLIAMVEVRDPVGIDQFELGGHGTAFDRVGAFQQGFAGGLTRCAELLDEPLPLMPNVFQPGSLDEVLGGNAPYDCSELAPEFREGCVPAPVFLAEDLNHYWQTIDPEYPTLTAVPVDDFDTFACPDEITVAEAVSYCPRDGGVVYDEPYVLDLYREWGDFTLGYFYGITWADVQQVRTGSPLTGEPRALLNDCWTGAWVRDITPGPDGTTPRAGDRDGDGVDDTVTSSPGDLDEAVRMAILLGDLGANVNRFGSPFEKIAAFRDGMLGGAEACPA